jgi:hypothetical protein
MAQVRNISPDKLTVGSRTVDKDELLEVPDADFIDRAWPTSTWKLVKAPTGFVDQKVPDAIHFAVPVLPETNDKHDGQE